MIRKVNVKSAVSESADGKKREVGHTEGVHIEWSCTNAIFTKMRGI